jgi:hypothetical protein
MIENFGGPSALGPPRSQPSLRSVAAAGPVVRLVRLRANKVGTGFAF